MMIFKQINTSIKMVEEFLKLTRSNQRKQLAKMSPDEVKELAKLLVEKARLENCNISYFENDSWKTEESSRWIGHLKNLLKQFPEVPDERLAIDRGITDFDTQKEFIEAIAQDINSGKMSRIRHHELLHINLFEEYDEYISSNGITSGTLLAFILPQLDEPSLLLANLKRYNPKLFENYIETPNQYVTSTGILETKPLFELYNGYWKELGLKENHLTNINIHIAPQDIRRTNARNQEARVDTHNTASHKSADESHVTAFRIFANNVAPDAHLTFSNQDRNTGIHREITVANNAELNAVVAQKNNELKNSLDRLLVNDSGRNARIYNELLKYTLTQDYIAKDYKDLQEKEKSNIDKKIEGFIFKARAAKRHLNDMLTNHRIDGGYYYNTTDAATCGLNMEQMVAACYFATTDGKNFKKNLNVEDAKKSAFVALIEGLYDMRRGYDIDGGTDNPDDNIFPKYNGRDSNRCHGGSVNSLASALKSIHTAYNIEIVTPKMIEDDIANFYRKCNVLEIVNGLQPKPSAQEFAIWTETGIPPKSIRDALKAKFKNEYENEFDSRFAGYTTDGALINIKQNALNNIKTPDPLKQFGLNYDSLNTQEICDSIVNGTLPFLRFDPETGYQTRLTHYINRAQFVRNLVGYFNALDKNVDCNQQALLLLANSNLPIDVTKRIVIKTIGNAQFTLNDIKGLGKEEFAALIRYNNKNDLLDWCADNTYQTFNLLNLVISKLVTNLTDELQNTYGISKSTILHIASSIGDIRVIAKILELPDARYLLSKKTKCGSTPLHFAAMHGNASAINLILNISEFEPEQNTLKLLTATDAKKNTPLHLAINFINISALKSILTRKTLTQAERLQLLTTKNDDGYTPAHYAAETGNINLANAIFGNDILTKDNLFFLLTSTIKYGDTPLHLVVKKNYGALANCILNAHGLSEHERFTLLNLQDKGGRTPLHFAASNTDNLKVTNEVLKATTTLTQEHRITAITLKTTTGTYNTALYLAAKKANIIALADMINYGGKISLLFVQNQPNEKTVYECLTTTQKLELAQKIAIGFENELSNQDKNRVLQNISNHLSTTELVYASSSYIANQAEQNPAELLYSKEYDRLLDQVINDISGKSSRKREVEDQIDKENKRQK